MFVFPYILLTIAVISLYLVFVKFSLLTFSIVVMITVFKMQIGEDIAGLVSELEMFRSDKPIALHFRSIISKKDFTNRKYN